jgi:hypothetical protein
VKHLADNNQAVTQRTVNGKPEAVQQH